MRFLMAFCIVWADYIMLTNFKAFVFMSAGTLLTYTIVYGLSMTAAGETAEQYRDSLMYRWVWYRVGLGQALTALLCAVFCIMVIGFLFYYQRGYSVNASGVFGVLAVLVTSSFYSHYIGTLRGFAEKPAGS